ncbi:MAG: hypothetical protein KF868_08435 [Acidobacteria bacterium]|nr:hypothetical protein [Acidobacteriota bacterium]
MRQTTVKILWTVVVLGICAYSTVAKPDARLFAVVTALPDTQGWIGEWTVGGRVVRVTAATRIDQRAGPPEVGIYVKVEGPARADGSIDAAKVETSMRGGGGVRLEKFRGVVESLPSSPGLIGDWTVGGRTVRVTATTTIKQKHGPVAVGVTVEVEGIAQNDGSFVAVEIETQNSPNNLAEFRGVVESLPSDPGRIGDWIVSGRTVRVTADTRIMEQHGPAAVGALVQVTGTPQQDGSIIAVRIQVEKRMQGNPGSQVKFFGTIEALPPADDLKGEWIVSGRKVLVVEGTIIRREDGVQPEVGGAVEVLGRVDADDLVTARMIVVKGVMIGNLTQLFGVIEELPMTDGFIGDWKVAGRTVRVTDKTRIKREYRNVAEGAFVEVRGRPESDGALLAVSIDVKQGAGAGGFVSLSAPAISVNAASYSDDAAPAGILAAFGRNLSATTAVAGHLPLPVELGGVSVLIDGEPAGLFFVSPGQINYQLPPGAATGSASIVVMSNGEAAAAGLIDIGEVAPGLFTADSRGAGAPAGLLLRLTSGGEQIYEPLARADGAPAAIHRNEGDRLFLVLFGVGVRGAPDVDGDAGNGVAESVEAIIGGLNIGALFAGPVADFAGLDQINLELPPQVAGALEIVVKVRNGAGAQASSNAVLIVIE